MDIASLQITVESTAAVKSLDNLNKAFDNTTKKVSKTSEAIDKLNKALNNIPTERLDKLANSLGSLGKSMDAFSKLEKQTNSATAAIKSTSKAVDKLSSSLDKLPNEKLSNFTNTISSADKTAPALDKLNSSLGALSRTSDGLGKASDGVERFGKSFSALRTIGATVGTFLAVEFLIKEIVDVTKQFYQAAADIEALRTKVNAATGEMGQTAGISFDFVKGKANELGISVKTASDSFAQIAAATKGTAMEGTITTEIWSKMMEVGVVLGQTNDQLSRSMKALGQMLSKQSVNAEELKGQLADAVPMAIKAAANAFADLTGSMGSAEQKTKALFKAMEEGKVPASVIIGLVRNMHDEIGGSGGLSEALAQNRMALAQFEVAWENLTIAVGNAFALMAASNAARNLKATFDVISYALGDSTILFNNFKVLVGQYEDNFPLLSAYITRLTAEILDFYNTAGASGIADKLKSPLLALQEGIANIIALLDFVDTKIHLTVGNGTFFGDVEAAIASLDKRIADARENLAGLEQKFKESRTQSSYSAVIAAENEVNKLIKQREDTINRNTEAERLFADSLKENADRYKRMQDTLITAMRAARDETNKAMAAEAAAAAERKNNLDIQKDFLFAVEKTAQTWVNLMQTPWNLTPIFNDNTLKDMQKLTEMQNRYKQLMSNSVKEFGANVSAARNTIQREIDDLSSYLLRKDLSAELAQKAQQLLGTYQNMLATNSGAIIARAKAEDQYDEALKRQNSTLQELVANVSEATSLFNAFSSSKEKNRKKVEGLISSNEEYRDILKDVGKAEASLKSHQAFIDKMDKVIEKTDEGKESAAKLEVQTRLEQIAMEKAALAANLLTIKEAMLATGNAVLAEHLVAASDAGAKMTTSFNNLDPTLKALYESYKKTSNAIVDLDKVSGEMTAKQDEYAKAMEAGARNMESVLIKTYEDIARGIHDTLSNAFEDIINGQTESFSDFFNDIKKMFVKWLADLAATAIANQITVPIVMSMNSTLSSFGMGATNDQLGNMFNSMGMKGAFDAYKLGKTGVDFFSGGKDFGEGFLDILSGDTLSSQIANGLVEGTSEFIGPLSAEVAASIEAGAVEGLAGFIGPVAEASSSIFSMSTALSAVPWVGAIAAIASLAGLFEDKPDNIWFRLGSGNLGPVGSSAGNTQVNQKDLGDALFSANGPFGKIFISGWEDIAGDIQSEFASTMVTAIKESDTAISQILGTALTEAGKAAIDGWMYQSADWVETKDPQNYVDDALVARYSALFSGIDSALGQAFIGLQDTTTATAEQVLTNAAAVATYAKVMDDTGLSAEELYTKVKEMGVSLGDGAEALANSAAIYGELSRQSKATGKDLTKLTKYFDIFGGATVESAAKVIALNNAAESYGTTIEAIIYAGEQFYGSQSANLEALANAAATNNPVYEQLIGNLIAAGDAANYTAEEAIAMADVIASVNEAQKLLGQTEYELTEAGYKAAKATADAAGGLDKLAEWSNFYYENLLTSDQKAQQIINGFISTYPELYKIIPDSALQSEEALRSWSVTAIELARAAGYSEEQIAGFFTSLWEGWTNIQSLAEASANESYGYSGGGSSDYGNAADQAASINETASMLFGAVDTITTAIVDAYIAAGLTVQEQLSAANDAMASRAEAMRQDLINNYLQSLVPGGYAYIGEGGNVYGQRTVYDPGSTSNPWLDINTEILSAEEYAALLNKPIEELMYLSGDIAASYVRQLVEATQENEKKLEELNQYAEQYGQENAQAMYDFMQKRTASLETLSKDILNSARETYSQLGELLMEGSYDPFAATEGTTTRDWLTAVNTAFGNVFSDILGQVIDPANIGEVFKNVHHEGWSEENQSWFSYDESVLQDAGSLVGKTYQQLLDEGYFFTLPQTILDQMREAALAGNQEYADVLALWDQAQQSLIDGFTDTESFVDALEKINEALRLNGLSEIVGTVDVTAEQIANDLANIFESVDNAVSAISNYGGFVLTDEERNILAKQDAQAKVTAFNNTISLTGDSAIDTAEELRVYVEGLDLSTEAGQSAFKAAMDLVDSLDLLTNSAQETAQAIADAVQYQTDSQYLWMDSADAIAAKTADITDAFLEAGVVLPESRDAYRDLILGIDATTTEGQSLLAFLKQWQDVFGDITETVVSATDATEEARAAVEDAWSIYQDAYNAEVDLINEQIDAINEQISAQEDLVSSYTDVVDSIEDALNSMRISSESPLTPEQQLNNIEQLYNAALDTALNGATEQERLDAYQKMIEYSQEYSDIAREYFGANEEYAAIWKTIESDLERAEAVANSQLNSARATLETLRGSLSAQESMLAALRSQYDQMERDYQVAVGTLHATMSVASAIDGLQSAIRNLQIVTNIYNSGGSTGGNTGIIKPELADDSGFWSPIFDAKGGIISITPEKPFIPPQYATGGIAAGWSLVGEEGPELVNFSNPGRVYTADDTAGMFGSTSSNDDVVVLLEEVLVELKAANKQRGQVAVAQIQQLDKIKTETEAQKRAIQRV